MSDEGNEMSEAVAKLFRSHMEANVRTQERKAMLLAWLVIVVAFSSPALIYLAYQVSMNY